MRRRRYDRARREWLPVVSVAFGAGLFLAMFCSARLALLVSALILVYVGITNRC